ncbi:hypothetical protein L5515_007091 [Caenorhabditis briggsae]|uniref:DUF281 domain-containing protein n=1 Tax=Caenorhabditis briggsae TaxID=6238 RepID=A0AAE9F467_CAEBR|nr:hypothetical protein L5515_007091 [Caenorhabditis briggsae]
MLPWHLLSATSLNFFLPISRKNTSSMNFIVLLTLFSLNSLIETCVRTIPPEEVYITSTEPSTDKPGEVTNAPVTNAPVTDAPVTDAPTNPCTICMVTPPTSNPAGTDFTSVEQGTAGKCKETLVTCKRTDDLTCNKVSIQTSTGVLIDAADTKEASALLLCQNDGTYSFGTITNIGQLSCVYEECASCTSCDISKLTLPMPVAGANFLNLDSTTADGCKQTSVTCERTDSQRCGTVAVVGSNGPIMGNLASTVDGNTVTVSLTCQADGTYSSGPLNNINQLDCLYETCAVPNLCAECDINAIAPANLPTGAIFNPTDIPDGNCKLTDTSCARNDGKICAQIITTADTLIGQGSIYHYNTNTAHAYLFCGENGLYDIGDPSATVKSITSENQKFSVISYRIGVRDSVTAETFTVCTGHTTSERSSTDRKNEKKKKTTKINFSIGWSSNGRKDGERQRKVGVQRARRQNV